ncbi:MAG: TlpA disulfide reductase family protein [Pedobacter sp.]|nr:TlpA disulfide reductase family protein [Pedobacter sp.]MDQ8052587.1 TlpA disulfide reductase family protein [Pedobacter sp.]
MWTKIKLTRSTLLNVLWIAVLAIFLFVPSAKAVLIEGLMEIGLFSPPEPSKNAKAIGTDLSDIRFKNAKGNVVSLADCRGKVVFLNFWATWCPPCRAEMSSINKLYTQFKDEEMIFLLVDADGNFEKAQAYMDRKKYQLPVYAFASDLPKDIFKGTLPTTLVLDKQGRISLHGEGAADYSSKKFTDFIRLLLKN